MIEYCIYKGIVYEVTINGDLLNLTSYDVNDKQTNGFKEYVDVLGRPHKDIFEKDIAISDVDLVYLKKINAIYKGKEFETYGINSSTLENNYILLFSKNYEDVNNYGFIKHEQFVYQKEVTLEDIDALVEIKKPILKWEDQLESRKLIPNNMIREYLSYYQKLPTP
ncbi:hypothetical protein RGU12_09015 [Fredinandcohnia sp. QZ13]|uniref:hypothetical protein n=1 Tax=Fredinandcohnia sp. QZ13 TaxID=3073144 RepID=UPI0028536EDA|nr:hypothetical protein [Fredinandcohnia sp. QZ13]MDR4887685.1 hypothetical protein [Fredinandcohnia sp. QZ13]